jgi:glycerol-1-phosphate dehydrogenase [NAD(P)+]
MPASASGKLLHIPIHSVLIEPGLSCHAGDLVNTLPLGKKIAVVSDSITHEVLGHGLEKSLGHKAVSVVLNAPKADSATVEKIRGATTLCDGLIAVGSGTINDLCKYASFLDHKPYAIFGTAPSMNGYASANAAITIEGHKKSLAAHLPSAIFLDTDILAAAPIRLIRSGLGDSLCRGTAQADWLLSHLLLGTAYDETPFALVTPYEETLCAHAKELVAGDRELVALLAGILVLSGFGMVLAGGSYPASQGEHMIAHTMEMVYGDRLPPTFHGEEIGVTSLTMAALQTSLLQKRRALVARPVPHKEIMAFYGTEVGAECESEMRKKHLSPAEIDRINNFPEIEWNQLAERITSVMLPASLLHKALTDAGNPLNAADLGWDEEDYSAATRHAVYSRNRFTFLDLAFYSGIL